MVSLFQKFAVVLAFLAWVPPLAALTLTSTSFIPYPWGQNPSSPLIQAPDGDFYGTTPSGGNFGYGTVFQMTSGGTLTTLVHFNNVIGATPVEIFQGNDGNFYGITAEGKGGPLGLGSIFKMTPGGTVTTLAAFKNTNLATPTSLIQATDGNFYGTCAGGGASSDGAIFRVTPDGTLTTLMTFTGSNGAFPVGIIQATDGNFYGTTKGGSQPSSQGNSAAVGTAFKMTPGGALTTLVYFVATNGGQPEAGLIQGQDGNFYGTTYLGGSASEGTVFELTPTGTLTTLATFNPAGEVPGYEPAAALAQDGNGNLYGTTSYGGTSDLGTVFKIAPGGAFTSLLSFTNTNGACPAAALTLGTDGNFYGSTTQGGTSPTTGTLFKMTTGGTLTTLVNFTASGIQPSAGLILGQDGRFYGTTHSGGAYTSGTIYAYSNQGALTTFSSFRGGSGGSGPSCKLVQDPSGNFYGTTQFGGSIGSGYGSVFRASPTGTITTLASFGSTNGMQPYAGLVRGSDGTLYGTCNLGGLYGYGTAYKVSPGGAVTSLTSFLSTNGAYPYAGLTQGSDGNFYGTTASGGSGSGGTVYRISPTGSLNTLVNFGGTNGANPYFGELVQDSTTNFYGTTSAGGTSDLGTVFQMTPSGTLTTLASLNTNGVSPVGITQATNGYFYGTTEFTSSSGGGFYNGYGTIYKASTSGALSTLVTFNNTNGAYPYAGMLQAGDGTFYGTTSSGGSANSGTVFHLDIGTAVSPAFSSAGTIPITASTYSINGSALHLVLNYAPAPGDVLTVIRTTGGSPISGTFTNLANGGTISATYNGIAYTFTANYSGGAGDDLTLALNPAAPPTDTPLFPPWGIPALAIGLVLAAPHWACRPKRR